METATETTSTIQSSETSTSQDVTDVQDTVETTTTSQEPENTDTEVKETETDATETEQKQSIDYEKSYKELQAEYTRNQQKLKDLEARVPQQPQIVNEQGAVNPQFEQNFNHEVEKYEFQSYYNLAGQLEPDVMPDVIGKLQKADSCYRMGDLNSYKALMNEVKEYFNPAYVEQIAEQKAQLKSQKNGYIQQAIQEQRIKAVGELEQEIRQYPEVWELVDDESPNFNNEVFGVVQEYFNNFGGIDAGRLSNFLKAVENNGVRKYKAQLEAQKTADVNKQKAVISSGDNKDIVSGNYEFGSQEYWENYYK